MAQVEDWGSWLRHLPCASGSKLLIPSVVQSEVAELSEIVVSPDLSPWSLALPVTSPSWELWQLPEAVAAGVMLLGLKSGLTGGTEHC